jgi:hypothetical protein
MQFGMKVIDDRGEGDPVCAVPATLVEVRAIIDGTTQAAREDLQVWSFFASVTARGGGRHPLAVEAGGDPLDRMLRSGHRKWALELTELTIADGEAS